MKILDGKKTSQKIADRLEKQITSLGIKPKLVIVQIGQNEASEIYLKHKIAFALKIGAVCDVLKIPSTKTEKEIQKTIFDLNNDQTVHGIIIQLPLPEKLNATKLINCIDPNKDVDSLTNFNLGKIINSKNDLLPATAQGIIFLLEEYQIPVGGKNVTVIGRSVLTGKSIAMAMLNLDATVTICHSRTKDLDSHIKNADIIISAVGKRGIVNDTNISENQIIVDVGINRLNNRIVGDVDLQGDSKTISISPVPGGVGPMTVASLFSNLLLAYFKIKNNC